MIDERDLYQEIELELSGATPAAQSGGRGFLAFALSLFSISLISLALVAGWIFLSEQGAVPSIAVMLNGTATPTATPTSLPTPEPTNTALPIPTDAPAEADAAGAGAALGSESSSSDANAAAAAGETADAAADAVAAVDPATATPPPLPTETPTPAPTPTPTATPLPWPPEIGMPLGLEPSIAGLSLEQVGGENPLRVLAELGHSGNTYLTEMQLVRAQTAGYLGDTSVQAEQILLGGLPTDPLFLIVGVMEGAADFNGQTGLMRLKVPWSETMIEANLSSALVQQVSNPSLIVNSWPSEGGWVWMLARSAELERGINACRNTLPSKSIFRMPEGERGCDPLQGMMGESVEVDAVVLMGIERDGQTLRSLLPRPAGDTARRWVYADLGRHGAQLTSPSWLTDILAFSDARENFGLLRATWDVESLELTADMVLDANTAEGITTYLLHWQADPPPEE